MPSNRRTRDLRLSVAYAIGDSVAVTSPSQVSGEAPVVLTVPIYHDWPLGDPDSARDPSGTQERAFVGTRWVVDGAGFRGVSVLQVDVYTRIGAQGDPDGDPLGYLNADIADAIAEVFAGASAGGALRCYVPILDFDNPALPAVPPDGDGGCLICQTPGGQFGVPSDRRSLGRDGGFVRTVVRFSFRTTVDAMRASGFANYRPSV